MEQISMIEQRDLLLVPFPFSDQSGKKVRPVIVISNASFNEHSQDILVVGVTSNISKDRHTIRLASQDLEEGNLSAVCCVKCENILKIATRLVIKKIGKVGEPTFKKIIDNIQEIIL